MDFFIATRLLEKFGNTRAENYTDVNAMNNTMFNPDALKQPFQWFTLGGIVSFVIGVLIGIVAIYLSWSCNTAIEYHIVMKVIFAVFAYLFGFVYILLYMILRYDTCAYIQKVNSYNS